MSDTLHPIPDAQAQIKVGRTKFYELIGAGEIITVNIGRRRFVPQSAIDAYIETLKARSAGAA